MNGRVRIRRISGRTWKSKISGREQIRKIYAVSAGLNSISLPNCGLND